MYHISFHGVLSHWVFGRLFPPGFGCCAAESFYYYDLWCNLNDKVLFLELLAADWHLKSSEYLNSNPNSQRSWEGDFMDAERDQRGEKEGRSSKNLFHRLRSAWFSSSAAGDSKSDKMRWISSSCWQLIVLLNMLLWNIIFAARKLSFKHSAVIGLFQISCKSDRHQRSFLPITIFNESLKIRYELPRLISH